MPSVLFNWYKLHRKYIKQSKQSIKVNRLVINNIRYEDDVTILANERRKDERNERNTWQNKWNNYYSHTIRVCSMML